MICLHSIIQQLFLYLLLVTICEQNIRIYINNIFIIFNVYENIFLQPKIPYKHDQSINSLPKNKKCFCTLFPNLVRLALYKIQYGMSSAVGLLGISLQIEGK